MNDIEKIKAFEAYSELVKTNKVAADTISAITGGMWFTLTIIFALAVNNSFRLKRLEEKEKENENGRESM